MDVLSTFLRTFFSSGSAAPCAAVTTVATVGTPRCYGTYRAAPVPLTGDRRIFTCTAPPGANDNGSVNRRRPRRAGLEAPMRPQVLVRQTLDPTLDLAIHARRVLLDVAARKVVPRGLEVKYVTARRHLAHCHHHLCSGDPCKPRNHRD